ncbi:MAG: universal stress protein [Burkholderiaceae bacterium]|nr:universal stress protein [Burkholderiaceae bacterium]
MFKKILFATDGSVASEHAAIMAINLARTHNATLIAVYVVDPYPYLGIGEMNPMGFQSYMAAAQEHSVKAFAHIKQLTSEGGAEVPMETRLVEEVSAHKGILQAAENDMVDLIIVGSHGRSGLEKLILGSIAAKVVSHSTRPVLIVR